MTQTSSAETSEPPSKAAALLQRFFGKKQAATLRTVIEDYIEAADDEYLKNGEETAESSEKELIGNILQLGDQTAYDVMIPRAEVAAIASDITHDELIEFIREHPQSRFPVYEDTLDNILGIVHLKDLFLALAPADAQFNLMSSVKQAQFISPSMSLFKILQTMRNTRKHMMLVVDEYGGVDGLVTMGDVVEAIVGRLYDEHDTDIDPVLVKRPDGSAIADGKLDIAEFEKSFGRILDYDEEDIDTVGGLVMSIAGRIPEQGETVTHEPSGISFTILESDARRVVKVKIRPKAEA